MQAPLPPATGPRQLDLPQLDNRTTLRSRSCSLTLQQRPLLTYVCAWFLCSPPHLNLEKLRNDLFVSELMENNGLRNESELLAFLERCNLRVGKAGRRGWIAGVSQQSQQKAKDNCFWLGLSRSWLDGDAHSRT